MSLFCYGYTSRVRHVCCQVQARIKGSLEVFFYDTEAGRTEVEQVFARPRALAKSPYVLEVLCTTCSMPHAQRTVCLMQLELCHMLQHTEGKQNQELSMLGMLWAGHAELTDMSV